MLRLGQLVIPHTGNKVLIFQRPGSKGVTNPWNSTPEWGVRDSGSKVLLGLFGPFGLNTVFINYHACMH